MMHIYQAMNRHLVIRLHPRLTNHHVKVDYPSKLFYVRMMFDCTVLHQYLNQNIPQLVVFHQRVRNNFVFEIELHHHNFQNSHSTRPNFPTMSMGHHYTVQARMNYRLVAHMHWDLSCPNRLVVLFEILCHMRLSKNPMETIDSIRAGLNKLLDYLFYSTRQSYLNFPVPIVPSGDVGVGTDIKVLSTKADHGEAGM